MSRQLLDKVSPIRVSTYCAQLERLHLWGTDEDIDAEFHAVCRQIWGYTVEDFDEDQLSREDHDFLDELTRRRLEEARRAVAGERQGRRGDPLICLRYTLCSELARRI